MTLALTLALTLAEGVNDIGIELSAWHRIVSVIRSTMSRGGHMKQGFLADQQISTSCHTNHHLPGTICSIQAVDQLVQAALHSLCLPACTIAHASQKPTLE